MGISSGDIANHFNAANANLVMGAPGGTVRAEVTLNDNPVPPERRGKDVYELDGKTYVDVSEQLVITDAFVLCSASNDRQVKAIVDEVEDRLREIGAKPVRREGERDGRWVLIDYAEIVVHVQHEEERSFYALERLWRDCPLIELPESVTSGNSRR